MRSLGVDAREVDIKPLARQLLADLGHPANEGKEVYDITYENVQAGLRTDFLFRLANQEGGIVVGTGDMSELALGWCTYGVGDHMSHYGVNGGLPKTLIQHLIRWSIATEQYDAKTAHVLERILATEISPELVPGVEVQSTQARIGPYALQDFNLFYTLRWGFKPSKIAFLADHAWTDAAKGSWPPNLPPEDMRAFSRAEILKWMEEFLKRFFATSQFKRSALPNGPKISPGGALSPRGDWRAPSDGNARAWLADLARIRKAWGL
jgi:NAD+ synthase (glutamine-hydrolysing)